MPMFRAGLAAAAMLIGGISAFLGMVVTLSALKTGTVSFSYGTGDGTVTQTVKQYADAVRYWLLVCGLGVVPAVLGSVAALWGWRAINR